MVVSMPVDRIYRDPYLSEFVSELEARYKPIDGTQRYGNLVNFSQNVRIPIHGWFRYREGYSHTLIKDLLDYSGLKQNEYVIDPFCGSGTTVVEAVLNGFSGLGIDVSPLSAMITRVKADSYTEEDADRLQGSIETCNHDVGSIDGLLSQGAYQDTRTYFPEENWQNLLVIRQCVASISDKKVRDLFMLGFLSIVEECSNRKRDGNGLRVAKSKVSDVKRTFILKMQEILADLRKRTVQNSARGTGVVGNALDLVSHVSGYSGTSGLSPGAIIFSPPYANSFDYFESYKIELRLGGFANRISDLSTFRKSAVRSFVNGGGCPPTCGPHVQALAQEIRDAIPLKESITHRTDTRTRRVPNMLCGYFCDMDIVLKGCAAVLPERKMCAIVVGQNAYVGKVVPTDLFLAHSAEGLGFTVKQIIVCRKARTSTQQIQRFPYLADVLRESIVILERKG